jgi:hypothetical protein
MIKHLLVHLDHTPAAPGCLEAALAAACGAHGLAFRTPALRVPP